MKMIDANNNSKISLTRLDNGWYKSDYGLYIGSHNEWKFLPYEIELTHNQLLEIAGALNFLLNNELCIESSGVYSTNFVETT